ncbi:hypothetical protein L2E82_17120 [Cichorium intybus]|uniref:Uncharacterized protein n=1 Tax=Cichorium intybus TaxID=13427 RepID=A0ACB9F720_CICIN|nr:hypothetical protein L2E82_17120 [Cichorium intybus]
MNQENIVVLEEKVKHQEHECEHVRVLVEELEKKDGNFRLILFKALHDEKVAKRKPVYKIERCLEFKIH